MNRKIIAVIVLGLVLVASLLACGYFGVKTIRRTKLRHAAMTAYENKEYALAERLLRQYVAKDPNAEAEFVALANVYHEFGNIGAEAQMWQTASSLNPLNPNYYEKLLDSASKSANYPLLHNVLGRKVKADEKITDEELYLYVISSCRSGYSKDGNEAYKKKVETDPEAFHKSELGQLAEFIVAYQDLSGREREDSLNKLTQSENPVIRFEALFTEITRLFQQNDTSSDNDEIIESLLKRSVEANYFAGTPLLADYYFSKFRFDDVIEISEPYLKTIDDIKMYLLYAESYAFSIKLDELKTLEQELRRKGGNLSIIADYCNVLIAFLEKDEEKLAAAVRKSGKLVNTPLFRFIRLRVAMSTDSFNEIRNVAQELFSEPPFHDLHDRALIICLEYISKEMKKSENQDDPSQMADLAQIMSPYLQSNQMLSEIILLNQYKKGLAKEADLLSALEEFPDDALLQRVTAEYLIFHGKSEQAMSIIESILADSEKETEETAEAGKENPDSGVQFLYMLALDQLGREDEAMVIFRNLVEQSEFNLELLAQYFQFCVENKREKDLTSMADKLEPLNDGKLEHFGKFFRAASILVKEDKDREKEALDLLASTPTGDPNFTFYAANRLSEHNRLDEAEEKYKAILKTYRTPPLIYLNLSELYQERGDKQKALDAAKEAYDMDKSSMLPAFVYAKRLSEAERYEDAVNALNFPRHAVNYREDIVALWTDCMHQVIENSIAGERYMHAEEQLKHLLTISPDDEFGKENLEKVQKLIKQQNIKGQSEQTVPAA